MQFFTHAPELQAAVVTVKRTLDKSLKVPAVPDEREDYKVGNVNMWGTDNLYPQNTLDTCEKDDIISSGLDWRSRALYGGGIELFNTESPDDPKAVTSLSGYAEMSAIGRHRTTRHYLKEGISDFYWHGNMFPTFVRSTDGKQILYLHYYSAPDVRLQLQDPKGLSQNIFVNANWPLGRTDTSEDTITVPLINKLDYYAVERLQAEGRSPFYALHCHVPKGRRKYYALPPWHSILSTGWIDIGQAVVQLKKYFIKNQMTLQYVIYVMDWYWKEKFKDWDKMTDEQRTEAHAAVIAEFTAKVKGESQSGSSLLTTMKKVAGDKEYQKAWIIEEIPTKTLSGEYLIDSQEATQHKLWALGIDSNLIGPTPGRNSGEHSGSSKREAFNMYMTLCTSHIETVLEPLEFIRDYNGYDPRIGIRFRQPFLQTLNEVTPAKRNTTMPTNSQS